MHTLDVCDRFFTWMDDCNARCGKTRSDGYWQCNSIGLPRGGKRSYSFFGDIRLSIPSCRRGCNPIVIDRHAADQMFPDDTF
ncbi:MAG TPA: hypothetical protein VLU73_09110, partial [Methylococcaceae bacterium]|nr:hypothetical protein [Methylococcaceae bacterium]